MECSRCGGLVTWRGPITRLTHTQCEKCGAINSQTPEIPDGPCLECDGSGWLDDEQTKICCECDGSGTNADE